MKATVKICKINEKNNKIAFCSVLTKNNIFTSELASGFLSIEGKCKNGQMIDVEINTVTTRQSVDKNTGVSYTWLVLS